MTTILIDSREVAILYDHIARLEANLAISQEAVVNYGARVFVLEGHVEEAGREVLKLIAERDALKDRIQNPNPEYTHLCRHCLQDYTPAGENENCPYCGSDGSTNWDKKYD